MPNNCWRRFESEILSTTVSPTDEGQSPCGAGGVDANMRGRRDFGLRSNLYFSKSVPSFSGIPPVSAAHPSVCYTSRYVTLAASTHISWSRPGCGGRRLRGGSIPQCSVARRQIAVTLTLTLTHARHGTGCAAGRAQRPVDGAPPNPQCRCASGRREARCAERVR